MSTSRAPATASATGAANHKIHALPANETGRTRWDMQHEAHTRIIGGLYGASVPVDAVLKPRDGSIPRILDVGTGSGIWAAAMANKFPHCEVVGIDLVLPPQIESQPPNLRFEVVDINLPLPMETASFDFVYTRMMEGLILDYPKWLAEASRILRANGVYHAISGNMKLACEDGTEPPTVPIGEQGYTGLQNMFSAFQTIPPANGAGYTAGAGYSIDRWESWMAENGNFDKISKKELIPHPFGSWQEGIDENTRIAGDILRRQLILFMPALAPSLVSAGYDEATVNRWAEDAIAELTEQRARVFHIWSSMWCIRSSEEWRPLEAKGIA